MDNLITPEAARPAKTTDSEAVGCRDLVRPGCDNCGSPATYSAYHAEGGSMYVCEDCMRWHYRDHSQIRKIWPRPNTKLCDMAADNPKDTNAKSESQ